MRKRTARKVWAKSPPPGLKPKLTRSQVIDLGLAHWANVETISSGKGTPEILYQHMAGLFTWLYVATLLAVKQPDIYADAKQAMEAAVTACKDMADRYRRTGRVGFSGPEYLMAKEACEWADALAEVTDRETAIIAAEYSERTIDRLQTTTEMEAA